MIISKSRGVHIIVFVMCMFHCRKQSSGLWQVMSFLMWLFLNAIRYWPSFHLVVCHLYSKEWFSQFNTRIIYSDHISLYTPPITEPFLLPKVLNALLCVLLCAYCVSSGLLHEHEYEIIYSNKGKLPEATPPRNLTVPTWHITACIFSEGRGDPWDRLHDAMSMVFCRYLHDMS